MSYYQAFKIRFLILTCNHAKSIAILFGIPAARTVGVAPRAQRGDGPGADGVPAVDRGGAAQGSGHLVRQQCQPGAGARAGGGSRLLSNIRKPKPQLSAQHTGVRSKVTLQVNSFQRRMSLFSSNTVPYLRAPDCGAGRCDPPAGGGGQPAGAGRDGAHHALHRTGPRHAGPPPRSPR